MFVTCLKAMNIIDFSSLPNLEPFELQCIVKANKCLTYLSLERSANATTDQTLMVVAQSCPLIRTLSLAYCLDFTGAGLEYISHGCRQLKEVSLAHCYELPADCLCCLVTNCTAISILTLEC
jgi:hypothetical protein